MTRKSPYKHKVGNHYRNGKLIEHYERGKGDKPAKKSFPRNMKNNTIKPVGYDVTVFFGKKTESHVIPSRTDTDAARSVLGVLETQAVPNRMRIRRITK